MAYISKCDFCVFIPEQKIEFWDQLNWEKSEMKNARIFAVVEVIFHSVLLN